MTGNGVFDLDRFVKAQDPVISTVPRGITSRQEANPLDVVHLPAAEGARHERGGPALRGRFA